MTIRNSYAFVFSMLLLLISSCSSDMPRALKSVPTAFGVVNQVIVVMDKELWEGEVGDTLRYYYSSAYPILPQPESIFDLKHFSAIDLEKDRLRKELRNYLFVADLSDTDSPTTKMIAKDLGQENVRKAQEIPKEYNTSVGKDKWAKGQLLIYQFANNQQELIDNLKRNFPAIKNRINKADREKIDASVYLDGVNKALMRDVKEAFDIELRIPSDYIGAMNDDNFIWMRREIPEVSMNLMVTKVPYTDQAQLQKEGIKAMRDTIGRKYISSELPNTFVRINDIDLPMLVTQREINGTFAVEARGIWEVVNDFMGGPFVTYVFLDPQKNELIFIDGFVYAPGKDKRNYMQYLEHVITSLKV
ncbi:MAG: DUF4837 family protein [Bacteroidota bacterium]